MANDLPVDPSSRLDDVFKFRKTLTSESDRGCGLMAAEYLDSQLKDLLAGYLLDDPKFLKEELLAHSRPLGSFSVRIDMAYMLGLIGPQTRRDLHLVRNIRNAFGHDINPIDFDHPPIASRCRELHFHGFEKSESPRRVFVQTAMGLVGILTGAIAQATHRVACAELLIEQSLKKSHREMEKLIGEILGAAAAGANSNEAGEASVAAVELAMRAAQQDLFDTMKLTLKEAIEASRPPKEMPPA